MRKTVLIRWLAASLLVLGACGGGRESTQRTATASRLPPPAAAEAPAAACDQADSGGMVRHRLVDGRCLRSFAGLERPDGEGARRLALAATAVPELTVTELLDWAEQTYPQYFPTHEPNLVSAPYTYRYYPQTQNHVGVADGQVYVLGPLSDGTLLHVGSVASYACQVKPDECVPEPELKPCTAVPQWLVGFNACAPNPDQLGPVPSGTTVAYLDSLGPTRGSATYTCNDGVMTLKGGVVCELAEPLACNTAGLTWNVAGNVCTANGGEPTQIPSGASHTFQASAVTVGQATYSCFNGALTATSVPTCAVPPPIVCRPENLSWIASGHICFADSAPAEVALGGSFSVIDSDGSVTGRATYTCTATGLSAPIDPVCVPISHIKDSFGNDGGPADGGASGDGTAGDGAPIVGGLVKVSDRFGHTVTATTDSIGYYRVKLTGFVPPLLISVTRPDGVVRRSISTQPLKTNGYIFMAVTGLTDRIASDVAQAAGFPGAASLTPTMINENLPAVTAATNAIRNDHLVRPLLEAAGIDPDSFDPFSTPFRADGTGYDAVLDQLIITTDANGATVIASIHCAAPTSWTVGNLTCTPDEGEETIVPNNQTVIHHDTVGPTTGSVGWTCLKGKIQAPVLPSCRVGAASSPTP